MVDVQLLILEKFAGMHSLFARMCTAIYQLKKHCLQLTSLPDPSPSHPSHTFRRLLLLGAS
jgi:hypothetical protein